MDVVETMVPQGMAVFAFDFAGSGLSSGKYVSLGFFEQFDIKSVVDYLSSTEHFTHLSIWGRSMGAVSAILYASTDSQIQGLVLDSPFTTLREVCKDMIQTYHWLPSNFTDSILDSIRKRIKRLAGFDIEDVNPIKVIGKCKAPCVFIHGIEDSIVGLSHSVRLYEQYSNPAKTILKVPGGHNTSRSKWVNEEVGRFLQKLSRHKKSDINRSLFLPSIKFVGNCKRPLHFSQPQSPVPASPGIVTGVRTTKELVSSRRTSFV